MDMALACKHNYLGAWADFAHAHWGAYTRTCVSVFKSMGTLDALLTLVVVGFKILYTIAVFAAHTKTTIQLTYNVIHTKDNNYDS